MPRFPRLVLVLALLLALAVSPAAVSPAASAGPPVRLGVVLLHDKNASPDKTLVELTRVLRNVGFLVALPEMPWSRKRGFDATYQQALVEISLAVQELRVGGATEVALVGHGLGGNAALGYAASRGGVCAVAVLAPSHDPERHREVFMPDVRKARTLLLTVGGAARSLFMDINQDKDYDLSTTAEVYLSYNDPDGEAVMPRSVERLKGPLPLLWVVGAKDPLSRLGKSYAFAKAPEHPLNRYEEVYADHARTPMEAAPLVAEWLKAVIGQAR